MLLTAALISLVAQVGNHHAVYCDPPIFIPPSAFATQFTGEVIEILLKGDADEPTTRRTALVQPRELRIGRLPSGPVEVTFYVSVDQSCAHMQRTPVNGDLVDVYLSPEGQSVGWKFLKTPSRPN